VAAPLSVIVPTRDTRDLTLACLESIVASDGADAWEIVLVDDGSTDGTSEAVRRIHPRAIVVARLDSGGFTAAANDGLRAASGEILLLLNSDTEVSAGAIARLRNAFELDPLLGVAGAQLVHSDGAPQWSAGGRPSPAWLFGVASGLPRALGRVPGYRRWKPVGRRSGPVDWVSGAAMAIRRAAWEEAGPLDERFRFYCQDLEYCGRLRAAGWRVAVVEGAIVRHRGGATIGKRALPLLWSDLVRWSALTKGPSGAKAAALALSLGARLRLAARALRSPWVPKAIRPAFREETRGYREALSAVRACRH
jgi:GT2 family glycosyltransferase